MLRAVILSDGWPLVPYLYPERRVPVNPLLGCIADDITGATDLALMLGRNGMPVVQYIGLPEEKGMEPDSAAVVIALKTRTAPVREAVTDSIAAARWLKKRGVRQLYFKYCSTFDSTDAGNIGPVAEALLAETGAGVAPVCPAFPANLRTVYMGRLFVGTQLLSESSMRHHPLTPMTDADLVRVLGRQLHRPESVALVPFTIVEHGPTAVRRKLHELAIEGKRFAVTDALTDAHLLALAEACDDLPFLTGGSGLAMGLPENFRKAGQLESASGLVAIDSKAGPAAVLAGSCSAATRSQVERMAEKYPALAINPLAVFHGRQHVQGMLDWAMENNTAGAVLIYSSAPPEQVADVQAELGRQLAGNLVERFLAEVAVGLSQRGFRKLIVAGGETSGAVLASLGIRRLRIGPAIEPGVPWTARWEDPGFLLVLKSGNFGSKDFFSKALEMVS